MKKLLLITVAVACASAFCAAPAAGKNKKELTPEQQAAKAQMLRDRYEYFGDRIRDTRSQKGKLAIVRCAKGVDAEWLRSDAKMIELEVMIACEVVDGAFVMPTPTLQGNASIFVVDDPSMPMSLIAPESRWAMVNVATLKTDKTKFYEMRVKKAVSRAFALLCGAASSQYPMSLVENIQNAEDFDKYPDERLQYDLIRRFAPYMQGYGITPYRTAYYRKACQQGWAPAPTNAVQKAIWEEIHALPTEPIEIKPEK